MQAPDRTQPSGLCGFRAQRPDLSSPVNMAIFTPLLRPIPRPFQASSLGASSERRRYEETQAQKGLPFALFLPQDVVFWNSSILDVVDRKRFATTIFHNFGARPEKCEDYIYAVPSDGRPFFRHPSTLPADGPCPAWHTPRPTPRSALSATAQPATPHAARDCPNLHHFSAMI